VELCDSLIKLETLELRENMLRYLPSSVSRLVKLRSLDLGDNVLEELVSSSSSSCFCCCSCCSSCRGWQLCQGWFKPETGFCDLNPAADDVHASLRLLLLFRSNSNRNYKYNTTVSDSTEIFAYWTRCAHQCPCISTV